METKTLLVYTDGGARGNPGPAGIGIYITDESGTPVDRRYRYLGHRTNNESEYLGAYYGIERTIELGATHIILHMDSELVVKQLRGEYRVKQPHLQVFCKQIKDMVAEWGGTLEIIHIRREKNKEADRLSNKAMDEGGISVM